MDAAFFLPYALGMKSKQSQETMQNNERFELHAGPGPDAEVLGKFATREAADNALAEKQKENPSRQLVIADLGVPEGATAEPGYAEAAKPADQKAVERAQEAAVQPPTHQ